MSKPATSSRCKTEPRLASQQLVLQQCTQQNPLRILEPRRKMLTSLKAERIVAVLEETIKNIQIVLTLRDILKSNERFTVAFGQQLSHLIQQQEGLRLKYEYSTTELEEGERLENEFQEYLKLKEKQGSLFSETSSDSKSNQDEEHVTLVNGKTLATLRDNLVLVKKKLSNLTRDILREFRNNPAATKTILEQTESITGAKSSFIKDLGRLHAVVKARLLTGPAELEERRYYISKVVQRENKIYKMKEKLQEEYDLQLQIKREEERKRQAEIDTLKDALAFIKETAATEHAAVLSDATKRIAVDQMGSDSKVQEVLQESIDSERTFCEELTNHFADEREKRKRKFKLSTEVFNWIQKYDADVGMRQDNYDALVVETDGIRRDLGDLGHHFLIMEREYLDIMQARKLAEEAEEQRLLDLEKKTIAAIRLQACWRGYRTRKMRNKNKKGKKGKKK